MQLVLTSDDLSKLKAATRQDLASLFAFNMSTSSANDSTEGLAWDDVADLSLTQVEEFMTGCSEKTVAGLKVFAEHGPKIVANLLNDAGIENYGHFQGRVTQRTRTITGDKHAFLFTWDDWSEGENGERGFGHYAVSQETFRSLRLFFGME